MLHEKPLFRTMGDRALLVEMGDEINPPVNRRVRALFLLLDHHHVEGLVEMVPSYRSLLIVFDPLKVTAVQLIDTINTIEKGLDPSLLPKPKLLKVPVVYGGSYGPDLEWMAAFHGLSPEEVIRLHAEPTYQVYMIGFMPGFPYMGEVPQALATPRREIPRTSVPQGSVAVAQRQTGIYPFTSPGGWRLLGWTPLELFDAQKQPPSLLEIGDFVKFIPVQEEEIGHWKV
ncbi:MAG: 5-oxoprolinase subunit PxpB [Desulfobacterales bacterium]|nr:5-oxoprolinase subunit PxpB [Desulfobacterales bacterium]